MPLSPQAWAAPEGLLHGLTQLSQALMTAPAMARRAEREDALEGLRAALMQQDLELKPQKLAAYQEQIEASRQARMMQAQQAAEAQQLKNDQLILALLKAQYPAPDALTQLMNPGVSSGLASDPRYKALLERATTGQVPEQATPGVQAPTSRPPATPAPAPTVAERLGYRKSVPQQGAAVPAQATSRPPLTDNELLLYRILAPLPGGQLASEAIRRATTQGR